MAEQDMLGQKKETSSTNAQFITTGWYNGRLCELLVALEFIVVWHKHDNLNHVKTNANNSLQMGGYNWHAKSSVDNLT